MRRSVSIVLLIAAFLANSASAVPTVKLAVGVPFPASAKGTAVANADGTITFTLDPNSEITITGSGPTPPPPPPPGPVVTERAKAVKSAAEKVTDPKRADNARVLAELYRQIAQMIGNQAKGYSQIMMAASTGTDMILKDDATKSAWVPVRAIITAEANNLARAGASDAEYAKYFQEVATGLDASTPIKSGISPELWKFLVDVVIPYLLKMLLNG